MEPGRVQDADFAAFDPSDGTALLAETDELIGAEQYVLQLLYIPLPLSLHPLTSSLHPLAPLSTSP